jgi:hypothetical protein
MKSKISAQIHATCLAFLMLASQGHSAEAQRDIPPLGLPRLAKQPKAGSPKLLEASKFSVTPLVSEGDESRLAGAKDGAKILNLAPREEWSRPLRGNPNEPLFVSFALSATQETSVDIAGVTIRVGKSAVPNFVEIQPLNIDVKTQVFDGKSAAALPVITVRLDPANRVYDIFYGSRLVVDNAPFQENKKRRSITITGGSSGASVYGVVQSDESPLYVDENANGVSDEFELKTKGRLAAKGAIVAEHRQLAREWKQSDEMRRAPAIVFNRPRPDGK